MTLHCPDGGCVSIPNSRGSAGSHESVIVAGASMPGPAGVGDGHDPDVASGIVVAVVDHEGEPVQQHPCEDQ
jgi:hypothetical protein